MSRPTHIYTEDQFPLDEQAEESMVPDDGAAFPVLVQWDDLQESPTQAVIRLHDEVAEQAGQAEREQRAKVAFQKRIDRMGEFVLLRDPENEDRTNLVHQRCGKVAGVMSDKHPGTALDRLYERTVAHDCTIEGLVAHAGGPLQSTARMVRTLVADRTPDTIDEGYLTALTDLLWGELELPPERRRDVAAYIWEAAADEPMPWTEETEEPDPWR